MQRISGIEPAGGERRCRDADNTGLRRWVSRLVSLMRAKAGTAAVEFGLTAPLLLGLLVPMADLGIAFSEQLQVQQAAQAGAQYASYQPWNSNSSTAIANAVTSATTLAGLTATPAPSHSCGCPNGTAIAAATCGSTCSDGTTAGYYVVVNAQLAYTPVLPYSLLGSSVTLAAQSTIRVQ